jgi:hypothetical protein
MRLRTTTFDLVIATTFAALILCAPINAAAQSGSATKFDSYENLPTDDEAAHLDAFYEALRQQPDLRGYLIGYKQASIAPGVLLRRLYGDQRYLIEMRGVAPNRVVVIEGGYKQKSTIELWLVPNGAPPPAPTPAALPIQINTKRYLFDDECLECEPAVNLDLYGLTDGIRFYAVELQRNPNARAIIVVRPGEHLGVRKTLSEARRAKWLLIRDYKIAAGRITINPAPRGKDNLSTAELWIVPGRAK